MEIAKMSSEMLLFTYSYVLRQLDQLYKEKKDIEKEIASRNDCLKQRYEKGLIKLEREDLGIE